MQDIFSFLENHWMLSSALLIVLILLIFIEFLKQKGGGAKIGPSQLTHFINHQNAVVLDIRDADAFKTGHIVDAISMPAKDFDEKLKKLEKYKNQPIVLVCGAGIDSHKKYLALQTKGYNTYVLNGGLRAWKEAGMPLVKS